MKHIGEKQLSVLLCVGFLSQIFVGSSQPYGVNAAVLLPVVLLGTLLQCLLFGALQKTACGLENSPLRLGYSVFLLCFIIGFDVVKADRFYRTVTSNRFSFEWMAALILLIGLYAACCRCEAVARAALPVFVLALLSIILLAVSAGPDFRLENLQPFEMENPREALLLFIKYSFPGDLVIWYYWRSFLRRPKRADWQKAVWLRFAVVCLLAVFTELLFGARFRDMPQAFGMLTRLCRAGGLSRLGVLYHCIWLGTLAARVSAACVVLSEILRALFPSLSFWQRMGIAFAGTATATLTWYVVWNEDCMLGIAAAVAGFVALCCFEKRRIKKS